MPQCLSRAEFPGAAEAQQAKAGPEPKPIKPAQYKHSGHWDGEGYSDTMATITSQDEDRMEKYLWIMEVQSEPIPCLSFSPQHQRFDEAIDRNDNISL